MSDFHDFTGADLYRPNANVYADASGKPIPLVRMNGKDVANLEDFARLEAVLGPVGGQALREPADRGGVQLEQLPERGVFTVAKPLQQCLFVGFRGRWWRHRAQLGHPARHLLPEGLPIRSNGDTIRREAAVVTPCTPAVTPKYRVRARGDPAHRAPEARV